MSVKFETIKAGDRLFDVRRATGRDRWLGGSKWSTWTLEVLEVDVEKSRALVSWNTNRPEWKPAKYFAQSNIRRKLPAENKGDGKKEE